MPIFDTHAHYYDDAFDADRHELLSSLPQLSFSEPFESKLHSHAS